MTKIWITLTLLCTGLWVQVTESHGASLDGGQQIPRGPATQSVNPPNFPPQPQFTHWSHVTPFALERANQFRPGPPPALTSDTYSDGFNEVKALGIVNSTASTADQALTGRFWNGAIQNYWNEITQTAALEHNLTTAQSARVAEFKRRRRPDPRITFQTQFKEA
jgi:hypothetical protein